MKKYNSEEIHKILYKKESHEVKYSNYICPICKSRIDEFGLCACDAAR